MSGPWLQHLRWRPHGGSLQRLLLVGLLVPLWALVALMAVVQVVQQGYAIGDRLLRPALVVSAIIFGLGVAGVLVRRNVIVIFMCVELMLNAVNLTFIALAQRLGPEGQVVVFFVMAVAAAEAAVGLAIILAIYRHKGTLDLQYLNLLRG